MGFHDQPNVCRLNLFLCVLIFLSTLDLKAPIRKYSNEFLSLAIGASSNDGVNGENSGHVRVFKLEGSGWIQLGRGGRQRMDFSAAGEFGKWASQAVDGFSGATSPH